MVRAHSRAISGTAALSAPAFSRTARAPAMSPLQRRSRLSPAMLPDATEETTATSNGDKEQGRNSMVKNVRIGVFPRNEVLKRIIAGSVLGRHEFLRDLLRGLGAGFKIPDPLVFFVKCGAQGHKIIRGNAESHDKAEAEGPRHIGPHRQGFGVIGEYMRRDLDLELGLRKRDDDNEGQRERQKEHQKPLDKNHDQVLSPISVFPVLFTIRRGKIVPARQSLQAARTFLHPMSCPIHSPLLPSCLPVRSTGSSLPTA